MKLRPEWPSLIYRHFCTHPSTASESVWDESAGKWVVVYWRCQRCRKSRGRAGDS